MPYKDPDYALEWRKSKMGKECITRWARSEKGRASLLRSKHKLKKKRASEIAEIKKKPCVDCGRRFPPECMDFHHVRGRKEFNIGTNLTQHSWKDVLKEVAKCILVCACCHRIRTKRANQN